MHSLDDHLHVEIVQAIGNARLVDYEGVEGNHLTNSGQAAVPGYYVVIWPYLRVDEPRFTNPHVRFYGPYDLAIFARLKVTEHVAEFIRLRTVTAMEKFATMSGRDAQPGR